MTLAFFAAAIVVGFFIKKLFKYLSEKYDHTRRIPILGLVVCFIYAFAAEKWFGIADITGAYVAGIVLSSLRDTHYIDRKVDINSYMIFSPVFFANIGISASFDGFTVSLLLFGLLFVAAGIAGKIVGCGAVARLCRHSWPGVGADRLRYDRARRSGARRVQKGYRGRIVCGHRDRPRHARHHAGHHLFAAVSHLSQIAIQK